MVCLRVSFEQRWCDAEGKLILHARVVLPLELVSTDKEFCLRPQDAENKAQLTLEIGDTYKGRYYLGHVWERFMDILNHWVNLLFYPDIISSTSEQERGCPGVPESDYPPNNNRLVDYFLNNGETVT